MKLCALLLFAISAFGADDGFAKFWTEFKATVARNDAKGIVRGVEYPLDWELGKVRKVTSEADFVAHFSSYFTADMRKAIATGKPELVPGNQYLLIWHARGNEYSFHFLAKNGTYVLFALAEGPP